MNFLADPITFITNFLNDLLISWGVPEDITYVILITLGAAILAIFSMLWVIFLIWYERKIISRFQDRLGPNRIGPWGIFQPFADMLKIFTKEYITPQGADIIPFNLAPVLMVAGVMMVWAVLPFTKTTVGTTLSVGVLYIIAVGGLGEMGIVLAGWGSNNKYSLIAAFRLIAQLVSYELPMVIALLIPVMLAGSMGLGEIVEQQKNMWFIFMAPVGALIFFITSVAMVGRSPFDLLEADSELVSGFNIEYSGLKFGMFYVGEFMHAFTVGLIFSTLFLGGWLGPGAEQFPILGFVYYWIKTFLVYFLLVAFRASFPRFRIDQMLNFNWKLLTPLALVIVSLTAVINKILPGDMVLVRTAGLLVLNVVLFLGVLSILKSVYARRPRPVVAPVPRPVASSNRPTT